MAIVVVIATSGCSLSYVATPRATYAPVDDPTLYSRIERLAGVTGVHLRWTNGFDNPNGYRGIIDICSDANAARILDRALAILRQGRVSASLDGVQVAPDGQPVVFPGDFGLRAPSDYTARYGPQPGSGLPPPTPLQRSR